MLTERESLLRCREAARLAHYEIERAGITVGIPAYNEEGRIGSLLKNMDDQLYDQCTDVKEIVVNASGSSDGTRDEVLRLSQSLTKTTVKVIMGKERMGKATALDDILKNADCNVVVFIDGDTLMDNGALHRIIEPFSREEVGVVSGNVLSMNDEKGFFSFASNFQRELHDRLCRHSIRQRKAPKVNGTFYAIRRKIVRSYPKLVVSDDEYASCLAQRQGYEVVYMPTARVYTRDPCEIRGYFGKRRRVFCGHILIKRMLNYTVPTTSVVAILPAFLGLALKYWRFTAYIATMLFLEALSRILGFSDAMTGRIPFRYRAESSKSPSKRDHE